MDNMTAHAKCAADIDPVFALQGQGQRESSIPPAELARETDLGTAEPRSASGDTLQEARMQQRSFEDHLASQELPTITGMCEVKRRMLTVDYLYW